MDFGDPEREKEVCDTKVAIIETHELRHMNECHDLQIARKLPQVKLDCVDILNNFEFSCDTATVCRAFDTGKAKNICISKLNDKNTEKYWPKLWTRLNHCKYRMLPEKETTKQS